jgi:hypothetical protein
MKTGIELIAEERQRQIEKGFTQEHDVKHEVMEFIDAANCYSVAALVSNSAKYEEKDKKILLAAIEKIRWPWDKKSFKPTTSLRDLVKAGALIAAAIDRLQKESKAAEIAEKITKIQ